MNHFLLLISFMLISNALYSLSDEPYIDVKTLNRTEQAFFERIESRLLTAVLNHEQSLKIFSESLYYPIRVDQIKQLLNRKGQGTDQYRLFINWNDTKDYFDIQGFGLLQVYSSDFFTGTYVSKKTLACVSCLYN